MDWQPSSPRLSEQQIKSFISMYSQNNSCGIIIISSYRIENVICITVNNQPPDALIRALNNSLPLAQNVSVGRQGTEGYQMYFMSPTFDNAVLRFAERRVRNVANRIPYGGQRVISVFVVGTLLVALALYVMYRSALVIYDDFLKPL